MIKYFLKVSINPTPTNPHQWPTKIEYYGKRESPIGGFMIPSTNYLFLFEIFLISFFSFFANSIVLIVSVLSPIWIFLLLASGEDFVKADVYKQIKSPQNEYCAEVVISDYGAMGGNTVVQVKNYKEFDVDLFFLKIEEKPKRVYLTEWDGWRTMEIYWKNENCLVIDGKEIYIE